MPICSGLSSVAAIWDGAIGTLEDLVPFTNTLPCALFFMFSGCHSDAHAPVLKDLFHMDYFQINVVKDSDTVELCGALKVKKKNIWCVVLLPKNCLVCFERLMMNYLSVDGPD